MREKVTASDAFLGRKVIYPDRFGSYALISLKNTFGESP